MAKESKANVGNISSQVCLMSDNLNYLCVKTKELLDSGDFSTINVVYDSVLNKKANSVTVSFEDTDSTVTKVRDLLGTSDYRNISITASAESTESGNEAASKEDKEKKTTNAKKTERGKKDVSDDTKNDGTKVKRDNNKKGAPSLSQEVLDYRYDVLGEYTSGKISASDAIKKLDVADGVFRNMVSDYNKCKRMNRKKAFGKSGIIKRTYQQYTDNKISSEQAAQNLNISVVTFLKWYKADTGNTEIGRGNKRIKK